MGGNAPHTVYDMFPDSDLIMKRKMISLEPGQMENQKPASSLEIQVLLASPSEPWGQHTVTQTNEENIESPRDCGK